MAEDVHTTMPPAHPLLRAAQEALEKQLLESKCLLEEELREKQKALKDAKIRREDLGVELFGCQQQLRGISKSLEESKERAEQLNVLKAATAAKTRDVRADVEVAERLLRERNLQAEEEQAGLEKLASLLRHLESQYTDQRGKLAVTKRETYAADEALQHQAKNKQVQDSLVLDLQRQVDAQKAKLARLEAQATRAKDSAATTRQSIEEIAAATRLVQADAEAVGKQWKEAVAATHCNELATQKLVNDARELDAESAVLQARIAGGRKEAAAALEVESKLAEALGRVQLTISGAESDIAHQCAKERDLEGKRQQRRTELLQAQALLQAAKQETKTAQSEAGKTRRSMEAKTQAVQGLKDGLLTQLQHTAATRQDYRQAAQEAQRLRTAADAKEAALSTQQSKLEELKAKCVASEREGESTRAQLVSVQASVIDASAQLEAAERAYKQRAELVEALTREAAAASQRVQQKGAPSTSADATGALAECVMRLESQLQSTAERSQELQRRWICSQQQLLSLQATNQAEARRLYRLQARHAVATTRCTRLTSKHQQLEEEVRGLAKAQEQQRKDLARFDGRHAAVLAERSAAEAAASDLEQRISEQLREEEEGVQDLIAQLQATREQTEGCLQCLLATEAELSEKQQLLQLDSDRRAETVALDQQDGGRGATRREVKQLAEQEAGMKAVQQRLLHEIQRAVNRRGSLAKSESLTEGQGLSVAARKEVLRRRRVVSQLEKVATQLPEQVPSAGTLQLQGRRISSPAALCTS